jgi:hypothetical protein
MAVTFTNIQQNDRGAYMEFTGDGATTVLPVFAHSQVNARSVSTLTVQPTITALVWKNATPGKRVNLTNTGLLGIGVDGGASTAVALASSTHSQGSSTVTLNAAATNAAVHYLEISFNNYSD